MVNVIKTTLGTIGIVPIEMIQFIESNKFGLIEVIEIGLELIEMIKILINMIKTELI